MIEREKLESLSVDAQKLHELREDVQSVLTDLTVAYAYDTVRPHQVSITIAQLRKIIAKQKQYLKEERR